jgi:hypothetical protein
MRSSKEIFEMREEGLYPCRYPKCTDYGNTASKKYGGVVCTAHLEASRALVNEKYHHALSR